MQCVDLLHLKSNFGWNLQHQQPEFPPCSIVGRVFSTGFRLDPLRLERQQCLWHSTPPSVLPVPPSTMAKCNDPALHEWVLDLKNDKSETSW